MLCGSVACWARGGPEPYTKDVDFCVKERGDDLLVLSVSMRVAAIDDIMATKLLALNESSIDLKQLLQIARALREQIAWAELHTRTRESPYAMAFFTLVEQLEIISAEDLSGAEDLPPEELPAPDVE